MKQKCKFIINGLFTVVVVLLFSVSYCQAITLEASYPSLSSGTGLTASSTVPEYLKYVFDVGIFLGFFTAFISLAWAGILYFLSGALPNARAAAKDRVSGAISGIIILALLYLIITTINPALSFFKTQDLEKVDVSSKQAITPGMSLYKTTDCSTEETIKTGSVPNLSTLGLNKTLQSTKIVNSPDDKVYFFSFLFQNPKYRGECLLINHDSGCKKVTPFASSVGIYKYSFTASGDITVYRNPSFNKDGGYFKIRSSDIQSAISQSKWYMLDLNNTKFTSSNDCTVPKDQQDCTKYNKNGECAKDSRKCPSLGGNNIGSIEINGDYLVMLVYYNASDPQVSDNVKNNGAWNLCQAFPTPDDINKTGPRQVKWEDIRNNSSVTLPNWLVVIPIDKESK